MKRLTKLSIVILGLLLICYAIYYFYFDRKEYFSLAFFVLVAIWLFLNIITFYPNLIIGMKIPDMKLITAQHYHSMIVNMILGFSAVIGIGITLLWTEQGLKWRTNVSFMFAYLIFYFIIVMYMVFLKDLKYQIAKLNLEQ